MLLTQLVSVVLNKLNLLFMLKGFLRKPVRILRLKKLIRLRSRAQSGWGGCNDSGVKRRNIFLFYIISDYKIHVTLLVLIAFFLHTEYLDNKVQ